jgi:hypothetical protein
VCGLFVLGNGFGSRQHQKRNQHGKEKCTMQGVLLTSQENLTATVRDSKYNHETLSSYWKSLEE